MGLKINTVSIADISRDNYLRLDEKYHRFLSKTSWNVFESTRDNLIPLKDILTEDYNAFQVDVGEEYRGIPTGQAYVDEDGYIRDFLTINEENRPARLKYRITENNILISSLRLAKVPAMSFEGMDLSRYIFSNGFYIFKLKQNWNKKFILYLLRTKAIKAILDNNIYRGIGISSYKKDDLLNIKIPVISKLQQDEAIEKIRPYEDNIRLLKSKIKSSQDIFNDIFSQEFGFNLDEVNIIEQKKFFNVSSDITYRNSSVRSSVRWNKIVPIQDVIYRNVDNTEKLGKYLKSTKNGWSPVCRESDQKYGVLGINCISKDTVMRFDDMKMTDDEKDKISGYLIQDGDLFVSRGNTVDLVALASIVPSLPTALPVIYPDLFIRIEVDETKLNKQYLAYLFNSVVGRLYFKYAAKGKNQSMVKISSDELSNFFIPVPSLDKQRQIVDKIESEISSMDIIRKNINIERQNIDNIISQALVS